jgi:hypothetical protein
MKHKNGDKIQTKPQFRDLKASEVHAALKKGTSSPISLEVGRLMVAYIEAIGDRKHPSTIQAAQDWIKNHPDCCRPIELVALELAINLTGNRQLLAVLKSVIPALKE